MTKLHTLAAASALAAFAFAPALAPAALAADTPQAEARPAPYEPVSGQPGKDVVWVPTRQDLVDRMLDMAGITTDDYLVDLGSGDGRTVITAARRGARAHGIEYNPDMVALAERRAAAENLGGKATFAQGDIFESDFSKATVITLFLLPTLNVQLRPTLLDMKPGTRIVSNTFDMGEWPADESVGSGNDCVSFCQAYKWIVPAKVGGAWNLGDGTLKLTQTYQMLDGTLTRDGKTLPISDAKMTGSHIAFTAGGQRYSGEVDGARITGSIEGGPAWSAIRSES